MVPGARGTDLDDVRGELAGPPGDGQHLLAGGDAAAEGGETRAEHVGDEDDVRVLTDRAEDGGLVTDLAGRPHELGMGVADLVAGDASLAELAQQTVSGEAVIHLARAVHGAGTERHVGEATDDRSDTDRATVPRDEVRSDQTRGMAETLHATPDPSWHRYSTGAEPVEVERDTPVFGTAVSGEEARRLLGPVEGSRILDLGCGTGANAVLFARGGARVIAIDRSAERVAAARRRAEAADVRVELHQGNLADLAFLRSDTVDAAISVMALAEVGDLARVFRQVHRVLRPEAPFILTVPHPSFAMFDPGGDDPLRVARPYQQVSPRPWTLDGEEILDQPRTIAEVFTALHRSSFWVDQLLEPVAGSGAGAASPGDLARIVPPTLLLRARKQGN